MGRIVIAASLAALGTVALAPAAAAHDAPRVRAAAIGPDGRCTGDPIDADRVIAGRFSTRQQGAYVMVPFSVPRGTTALRVKYCFDQPTPSVPGGARNTIDLGLYEPLARGSDTAPPGPPEFRGWGGSSHPDVTLSPRGFSTEAQYEADPRGDVPGRTTRGFLPGPLPAGRYAAELGVAAVVSPALGNPSGQVAWRLEIAYDDAPVRARDRYRPAAYDTRAARRAAGWYAGDMHVHAEHSALGDATMRETFDFAFRPLRRGGAGLDFITLSDYVTSSAWPEIGRYQPDHRGSLIARSAEVITYRGHTNNHVSARYVDHRTGPVLERRADGSLRSIRAARPARDIFAAVRGAGGVTQINHPRIFPSSNPAFRLLCRGCPWDYTDAETDYRRVDAYEISTGPPGFGSPPGPWTASPFALDAIASYDRLIARGFRIAAVGVSDTHHAGEPENAATQTPLGEATTVARMSELSERGLAAAIRAQRTYVKLWGNDGPDLRLTATGTVARGRRATVGIGDELRANGAAFVARVLPAAADAPAGRTPPGPYELVVIRNGRRLRSITVPDGRGATLRFTGSAPATYRLQLERGEAVVAMSSPIWLVRRAALTG